MFRLGLLSVPLLILVVIAPSDAGIFRKSKANPAQVVPELIKTLQSDTDEGKRATAADELSDYDPMSFPDLIPALISALQKDASSSVRAEAAQTLGKLRPVNQQAGIALEAALQNDSSLRVRMNSRTALWQYAILGYRSGKTEEPKQEQTGEPPLAPSQQPTAQQQPKPLPTAQRQPTPMPVQPPQPVAQPKVPPRIQTQEPPLAPVPMVNRSPIERVPVVRPTPKVVAPVEEEGPTLNGPK